MMETRNQLKSKRLSGTSWRPEGTNDRSLDKEKLCREGNDKEVGRMIKEEKRVFKKR